MPKVSTNISLDADLKKSAQALFADFGLDMSSFSRKSRTMMALRENGCRIHSVIVPSRRYPKMPEFDSCWGMDPGKGNSGTFREITGS